MVDYRNTVIYKIYNYNICFIGSTTTEISRENSHKKECNYENGNKYNYYMYKCIRDNGGWDNWKFEVIEKYPCHNKREMNNRELYNCILLNRPSVKMCMTNLDHRIYHSIDNLI